MKKSAICLVLILAVLCLCGCGKKAEGSPFDDIGKLSAKLQRMTEAEVWEYLGQPSSFLSGFRGDVYKVSEDRLAIVYYNMDGDADMGNIKAKHLKIVDSGGTGTACWAGYGDEMRIIDGSLNAQVIRETMHLSSVLHLPVYRFDSKADIGKFMDEYGDILSFDEGHDEAPSFRSAVAAYDDGFFKEHCLLCVYKAAGSGSFRYRAGEVHNDVDSLCVYVEQVNDPESYTDDMAGWLILVERSKAELKDCREYDALYDSDVMTE